MLHNIISGKLLRKRSKIRITAKPRAKEVKEYGGIEVCMAGNADYRGAMICWELGTPSSPRSSFVESESQGGV
jgi:hypothetical protein